MLACAHVARADYKKVTLGPGGPRGPLPVGEPFLLVGEPGENVDRVWPVFVTYGRRALGFRTGEALDCGVVGKALKRKSDDVFEKQPGVQDVGQLFDRDVASDEVWNDLSGWHTAYVPSGWARAKDEKEFEILVDGRGFFGAGTDYCLFVYRRTSTTKDDDTVIYEIVRRHLDRRRDATAWGCKKAKITDCLDDDIKTMLEGAKNQNAVKDRLGNDFAPAGDAIEAAGGDAKKRIESLGKAASGWAPDGNFIPVSDPLFRIIADSLLEAGRKELGWNGAFWFNGEVQVESLRLNADLSGFTIIGSDLAKKKQTENVSLDLSKIPVPGTEADLESVLAVRSGRLRVGGKLRQNEDAAAFIGGALGFQKDAVTPVAKSDEVASALSLSVRRLKVALARSAAAAKEKAPTTAVEKLLARLGTWLGKDATALADTLQELDDVLTKYGEKHAIWVDPAARKVTLVKEELKTPIVSSAGPVALTQADQIHQYVTPLVGYTLVTGHPDSTPAQLTFGFELSLVPNAVNEPMWSHNWRDWRRVLALQVGAMGSDFGPQDRLGPPNGWPFAPYFAVAVHPVPYVSVSYGFAVVGERRSALELERPTLRTVGIVGFTLQSNVWGILSGKDPEATKQ